MEHRSGLANGQLPTAPPGSASRNQRSRDPVPGAEAGEVKDTASPGGHALMRSIIARIISCIRAMFASFSTMNLLTPAHNHDNVSA